LGGEGGEYELSVKCWVEIKLKYGNALSYARNKKTKPIAVVKSDNRDVNKHTQRTISFFFSFKIQLYIAVTNSVAEI